MSFNNENYKLSRFDGLMYSDPEHVVFSYSSEAKYLRLLQLQKFTNNDENNQERDYFQDSFHLRGINNSQGDDNCFFTPKRCFMLDDQLTVIQKNQQGKPINYVKSIKKEMKQRFQKKIFRWCSGNQFIGLGNSSQFIKQYYCYPQIKSFCFGRKHFVRALNSIQLSSDHISRNHCQLVIKKGKTQQDMESYFELLFGMRLSGMSKNNRLTNDLRRQRISSGNKLNRLTKQLWQIIYSFIFLSQDKYYLLDNGSRNGTFFIQCADSVNDDDEYNNNKQSSQQQIEYDYHGQKIVRNHQLVIKQGYSYEFEGEEYLMKVWRLTQGRGQSVRLQRESLFSCNFDNGQSIRYIQQFQDKINWFNNFQKVNKEFIIDENLLLKNKWKHRRTYQQMMGLKEHKQNIQSIGLSENLDLNLNQVELAEEENSSNESSLLITKQQFIKLISQQFSLKQKITKKYQQNCQQSQHQRQNYQYLQQSTNLFIYQHQINTMVISLDFSNDFKKLYCIITQTNKPNKFYLGPQMVINTARFQFEEYQKCNGYVLFDGYRWRLVSLSTKNNPNQLQKKKLYNNQIDQNLSEDQSDLETFTTKNKELSQKAIIQNKFAKKSNKIAHNEPQKQKTNYRLNLYKKLSNKIWTKIPATSLYELKPKKCSYYLIRLAHSFYFQLKFYNFKQNTQQNDLLQQI